jgi:hypothetical protein
MECIIDICIWSRNNALIFYIFEYKICSAFSIQGPTMPGSAHIATTSLKWSTWFWMRPMAGGVGLHIYTAAVLPTAHAAYTVGPTACRGDSWRGLLGGDGWS